MNTGGLSMYLHIHAIAQWTYIHIHVHVHVPMLWQELVLAGARFGSFFKQQAQRRLEQSLRRGSLGI